MVIRFLGRDQQRGAVEREPIMKATLLCGIGLIAALAGCGPIQRAQIEQQRDAIDAEAVACAQKHKSGEFKTHVQAVTCMNDAYQRGISVGLYPFPDIRLAWEAARLRAAEQLDRGEITETEAKAQLLDISAKATAEARRRAVQNAQTQAEINSMNAVSATAYSNMVVTGIGMMTGGR
jgi:hypothetical protein